MSSGGATQHSPIVQAMNAVLDELGRICVWKGRATFASRLL